MIKSYVSLLRSKNFNANRDRVNEENRIGVELILFFYAIVLALNIVFYLLAGRNILTMYSIDAQTLFVVVAIVLYLAVFRRRKSNYTLLIYLLETPMLLTTMLTGIFGKPHELTFTFLVYLLLFPLLILDKPWRVISYTLGMSAIYLAVASGVKAPAIFSRDIVHLINIELMSMSASVYFLATRIKNIEYAGYFEEKADEDPLTGIYNRSGARHHIDPSKPCVFLYVDLDQFKGINDRYGHEAGDHVLVETARVLRANFRAADVVARLGGDEFAVYAPGSWNAELVHKKLQSILDDVSAVPAGSTGAVPTCTASIGCALAPHGCESVEELARVADQAMYQAKQAGKNGYHIVEV